MVRERNRHIFLAAATGLFHRIVQRASSPVILPRLPSPRGGRDSRRHTAASVACKFLKKGSEP